MDPAVVFQAFLLIFLISPAIVLSSSFCGVQITDRVTHVSEASERALRDDSLYPSHFGELKIPIAFFYDKLMYKKLGSIDELHTFIRTLMKTVQVVYDSPFIQQFARVTFYVVKIQEASYPKLTFSDGDAYEFLKGLPAWASTLPDYGKWQAAVLLTGVNSRSSRDVTSVREALSLTGLANMERLCLEQREAVAVVEARNFNAAFVLAHEIGHILNMNHDGSKELGTSDCSDDQHLMSPSTGDGKVEFSACSARGFQNHLRKIWSGDEGNSEPGELLNRCLNRTIDKSDIVPGFEDLRDWPPAGVLYDADRQCQFSYGKGYRADFDTVSSICPMIFCDHNFWQVKSHPALPGTQCATNKRCSPSGKCV